MESHVKITAGIGVADDYISLVKAGADEVFCGFVPFEWNQAFGNNQPLNRREVLFYHVQIGSYSEMKILWKMQQKYGVPVAVAFNALYYTKAQIEAVLSIMQELMNIGFRDFIVCDLALLIAMKKAQLDCNVHMSGEIGEWNQNTLEILKEFVRFSETEGEKEVFPHIKRIIFHRKNTISDMKSMIQYGRKKYPHMEYEAFFLNEMCHFTGGYCNSIHCDEMVHLCQMPYKLVKIKMQSDQKDKVLRKWKDYLEKEEALTEEELFCDENSKEILGESGCGLCALWDLVEAGITHLKIVGRGKCIADMEHDVKNIQKAVEILKISDSKDQYRKQMMKALFREGCSNHCYYREK